MYIVCTMKKSSDSATVLTIRLSKVFDRKLAQEARRLGKTRSETARALLESALQGTPDGAAAAEARRQPPLASQRESGKETLAFIVSATSFRGWE
jgi:predicted DNA-binding protein